MSKWLLVQLWPDSGNKWPTKQKRNVLVKLSKKKSASHISASPRKGEDFLPDNWPTNLNPKITPYPNPNPLKPDPRA